MTDSKLTTIIKIPSKTWGGDEDELMLNVDQWLKHEEIKAKAETKVTGNGWAGFWIFLALIIIFGDL